MNDFKIQEDEVYPWETKFTCERRVKASLGSVFK